MISSNGTLSFWLVSITRPEFKHVQIGAHQIRPGFVIRLLSSDASHCKTCIVNSSYAVWATGWVILLVRVLVLVFCFWCGRTLLSMR
jgi:hypothetical protein